MTRLLQDWVTTEAERRPDATAVVMGGERLTYGQLEVASNQLAQALRTAGIERGDRVCLLLPKCPATLAALLAVLKADAIYVPLDTSSPAARVAKIVASSEPRVILASPRTASLLRELLIDHRLRETTRVGWLAPEQPVDVPGEVAFAQDDVRNAPASPPPVRNASQDPAHILFTSGSTGMPKGVVITHANVLHFVDWARRYFGLAPSDRMSGHAPLHFDLSTFDIFGTFAVGGELHLVPPELNVLPHKLAEFMRRSELTQWFSVPAVLDYLAKFDVVKQGDFPTLKRLMWCGEVLPTPALRYWMTRLPHVRFTNLYGPTEATIASSYYTVPACPAEAAIPIGTSCDGEELLILDDELRPVPAGTMGMLYIRGVGLSPGYWRDPAKTAAAFLPNPMTGDSADRIYRTGDLARTGDDGLVHFHGRADWQIKSRGYRIELGEVEAALHALPCLQESAVVALPTDGLAGTEICCAYVPRPDRDVTPLVMRQELSRLLPAPMLPSRWQAFDRLPRNASGKIDRPRLQETFARR